MSVPPTAQAAAAPPEEIALELPVPTQIAAIFEQADRELREAYGIAPGAAALMRFWLTCVTPKHVRREFESAVLQLDDSVLAFENDDEHDGDDE